MYSKYFARGFNLERKKRSDKGEIVFNCEAKRRVGLTPLMSYKKAISREFKGPPGCLCYITLKHEFKQLPPANRLVYKIRANNMLTRSRFFYEEIIELLKNTHGMIAFREIQMKMNVCVDHVHVMNKLKSIHGYKMQKKRL